MDQKLFLKNDAVFQGDSGSSHTPVTLQSWFVEHGGAFQHLPLPAQ
jgi:hypothetical protein